MLIANIENVIVVDKTATKLAARVIFYDLQSVCTTYWWISDSEDNKLLDGNCIITPSVVENWGTDDMCILEDIANQKGFTII